MSFGGTPNKPFSGFAMNPTSLGQQQPGTLGTSSPFSFAGAVGTGAPPASSTGFSFGGGTTGLTGTTVSATPQLSFTAATPAATAPSLFSFSGGGGGGGGGLSSIASQPQQTTGLNLSLGGAPTASPAPSSFNFGTSPAPGGPVSSGPTIGIATPSLSTNFNPGGGSSGIGQPLNFGSAPPSSLAQPTLTQQPPLSFTSNPPSSSSSAAPSTIQPTFGMQPAASSAPPLSSMPGLMAALAGGTPSSTSITSLTSSTGGGGGAPSGLNFGIGSTASSAAPSGGLSLTSPIKPLTTTAGITGAAAVAPTSSILTGGSATGAAQGQGVGGGGGAPGDSSAAAPSATQLSTATATSQAASAANVSQMNFRQLQEAINKWMLDLQDQEKLFLDQATKVNSWDKTLIQNGDKIAKLNDSITKVKNDHTRLEHALDYLKTQQTEFENFLEPLEAGLPRNIPVEPEREQLYSLTENVDTQLQQMAEDLKEVIRHINESNKTVDKSDPISQILRILNEHTDALQWVEDNANQVRRSLDDVSKHHQLAKKEHERSLRQMYK